MSSIYRQRAPIQAPAGYVSDPTQPLTINGPIYWARVLRCLSGPPAQTTLPGFGAAWQINDGLITPLDGREILIPTNPKSIRTLRLWGACLDVEAETAGATMCPGPAGDRRGAWEPLSGEAYTLSGGNPILVPWGQPDAPEGLATGGSGICFTFDFDELFLAISNFTDQALDVSLQTWDRLVPAPRTTNTYVKTTWATVAAAVTPGTTPTIFRGYVGKESPAGDLDTSLIMTPGMMSRVEFLPAATLTVGVAVFQLFGRRR